MKQTLVLLAILALLVTVDAASYCGTCPAGTVCCNTTRTCIAPEDCGYLKRSENDNDNEGTDVNFRC